jgi:hypothetical protein
MQAQLIAKDGSIISLNDEQYQQILSVLGMEEATPIPSLQAEDIDALLDELEGISAGWGFSTDDLLEERRREREHEQRRES